MDAFPSTKGSHTLQYAPEHIHAAYGSHNPDKKSLTIPQQDSDDSDKDDDKDDDNATPGEAEPYMRPAIKTTTKAAAAPSVAKSKRASSDSLLKKTLISTARKTSATNLAPPYPTNAPFRAKKPLKPRANAQPFHLASRSFVLSNPIAATEDPFARSKPRSKLRAPLAPPPPPQAQLPHRPATAARVLGSPFSASSDTPPLASLRASNAAAEAGAALKRSKPSSAWEGRLARIQRASMRLQRVIAESDDPHGIFGAQLRDIDLETGGIR